MPKIRPVALMIFGAIAIVIAVAVVFWLGSGQEGSDQQRTVERQQTPQTQSAPDDKGAATERKANVDSDTGVAVGEMVLGKADAPVTVIEYASMTCPHCARFHRDVFKALKEKYVDTGKVRFVYRDFPLDNLAFGVSRIARCAGSARYFAFLEVLFAKQSEWSMAQEPAEELAKLARLAGIGREKFEGCLNDKALGDFILDSRLEGVNRHKIQSTPSFVINGTTHAGVQTIEDFDRLLKDLLPAS